MGLENLCCSSHGKHVPNSILLVCQNAWAFTDTDFLHSNYDPGCELPWPLSTLAGMRESIYEVGAHMMQW